MRQTLTNDYTKNIQILNNILRVDKSFDIIAKPMEFADKKSTIYFVDGFVKDDVMEKIMEYIMSIKVTDLQNVKSTQSFSDKFISYVEADITDECEKIVTAVLSGTVALVIEGYNEAVLIDARTYPSRGVQEPDDDRVLRGARDGFVETLVFNTALIRRRIRDPRLTMEITQVGSKSKTDVIICYMEGIADPKVINLVKEKIKSITI
ncbi:MAG: spore germination protein, partial [Oscillospiraceae bacterium]